MTRLTAPQPDYDMSIHQNPDARAWAAFFAKTFPDCNVDEGTMLGWFANAMMAMHDHLQGGGPLNGDMAEHMLDNPTPQPDNRVCSICDGGPGNDCQCTCGFQKWGAPIQPLVDLLARQQRLDPEVDAIIAQAMSDGSLYGDCEPFTVMHQTERVPQPDADEREAMVAVIIEAMDAYGWVARNIADALLADGWTRKREEG